MENRAQIRIDFVANAGLLVVFGEQRLLIDSLYGDIPERFSKVPEDLLQDIMHGIGDYGKLDYLLFTHDHIDHMNIPRICEYCERNPVKAVIAPRVSERLRQKFGAVYSTCRAPRFEIAAPDGEMRTISDGDLNIHYFKAIHDGAHLAHVEHYPFLLEMDGRTALILADSDFRDAQLRQMLEGCEPDVVFANMLTFNHRLGRELIRDIIRPKKTVVYHIPFEEDDDFNYRKVVFNDVSRYGGDFPGIEVFGARGDSIVL